MRLGFMTSASHAVVLTSKTPMRRMMVLPKLIPLIDHLSLLCKQVHSENHAGSHNLCWQQGRALLCLGSRSAWTASTKGVL